MRWSLIIGMMMATPAHAALFQHLTADDPASVTTNSFNAVTSWADKSGNGFHASPGDGNVIYPAATQFNAGTDAKGNFAGTNKTLQLGSIGFSSRFLNGSVGAVRLYSEKLSPAEFVTERDAMTINWLGVAPVMPSMPGTPASRSTSC